MPEPKAADRRKTSWRDAFKDPKVLIVLIPLMFGGIGASATLLMEVGELRSDVRHYQADVERMDNLIADLTTRCGGSAIVSGVLPTGPAQ